MHALLMNKMMKRSEKNKNVSQHSRRPPQFRNPATELQPPLSVAASTNAITAVPPEQHDSSGCEKSGGFTKEEVARLADLAAMSRHLEYLSERARAGDQEAFVLLSHFAALSCVALAEIRLAQPKVANAYIRTRTSWPVIWAPGDHISQKLNAEFGKIGIGSEAEPTLDHDKAVKGKVMPKALAFDIHQIVELFRARARSEELVHKWSRKSAAQSSDYPTEIFASFTRQTLGQLNGLAQNSFGKKFDDEAVDAFTKKCAILPEFSVQTRKSWFKVIREIFMYLTGGHPEEIDQLKWYGSSRLRSHGPKDPRKADYREKKAKTIQDGIIDRIRDAYTELGKQRGSVGKLTEKG